MAYDMAVEKKKLDELVEIALIYQANLNCIQKETLEQKYANSWNALRTTMKKALSCYLLYDLTGDLAVCVENEKELYLNYISSLIANSRHEYSFALRSLPVDEMRVVLSRIKNNIAFKSYVYRSERCDLQVELNKNELT